MNEDEQAMMYDQMINWDSRLQREIPVIADYFGTGTVLDVACSSGRHSLALAEKGFLTVGVDISEPFIRLARKLAEGTDCRFEQVDAATDEVVLRLEGQYFDHAILLGNAIANMGDFEKGQALIRHIFLLLRPGGTFFVQTVHRPSAPWYNPLRSHEGAIIQRIMVPVVGQEHNVVLHVNQISCDGPEYLKQAADNKFFMYTRQEFQQLVESVGFEVEAVYHHYSEDPVMEEDGETQTWRLKKPELKLTPSGKELFRRYDIDLDEVRKRTLKVWQRLMLKEWYHCIRGYRFLHPRIMAHPRYTEIAAMLKEKPATPFLDVACHMGTDLRQVGLDGGRNLMGVDLYADFIEAGYVIFDDRESCDIDFRVADVLSSEFMNSNEGEGGDGEFDEFTHHFGVIHAGSLLHLLAKDQVTTVVERMYKLLVSEGIFFGRTVGSREPTYRGDGLKYLHSQESLQQLLNAVGFSHVEVIAMPRGGPVGESTTDNVIQLGFYAKK